ncbi:hypothetical protein [Sediminicoccus sp. KRV36]|uniref:hypothetical protein n=1 Tax=Sediminicoccus sp. KRV36 TaxID=3133721 RepID=UPI00200FE73E|nr:hypothetical protein [Sediminicoccus rosea]UPY37110.1 hypothetical protein LHU95_23330 [Sediminicoccus rosea]
MWDFSVSGALGLMARTWPFLLFRMLVYFSIATAYVVLTGAGAGIGWLVGAAGSEDFRNGATFFGGLIGFGLTAGVVYLLREYILYVVKAGHIAVMIELMEGRNLPLGRAQIEHAGSIVKQRFTETNVLFLFDQLVRGVLGAILGLVQGLASFLPIPGLQQLMGLIRAFLRIAVGLMDEVILGHSIRTRSTNAWDSARIGLVLYAQNAGGMMRNAAFLMVIVWGLTFVIFLFMLAPAAAIAYAIPGSWSAGGIIFALLFAWSVKAALIEPFAVACMLQAFFRVTAGQSPDPAWDARISGVSRKFEELKAKAQTTWGKPA